MFGCLWLIVHYFRKMLFKQYFNTVFTINIKWHVVIGCKQSNFVHNYFNEMMELFIACTWDEIVRSLVDYLAHRENKNVTEIYYFGRKVIESWAALAMVQGFKWIPWLGKKEYIKYKIFILFWPSKIKIWTLWP